MISFSEKEIKCINFIESVTKGILHSDKSFFEHLYNTFIILKEMNLSEDVCLAGLFHSVYETPTYQHNLALKKEDVVNCIGEYAEQLVNYFCRIDRDSVILGNTLNLDDTVLNDLIYIMYANGIEQNKRLGQNTDMSFILSLIRNNKKIIGVR